MDDFRRAQQASSKFGWEEMDELQIPEVVSHDAEPITPPSWIQDALMFKAESAELLIGAPIMSTHETPSTSLFGAAVTLKEARADAIDSLRRLPLAAAAGAAVAHAHRKTG